MRFVRTPRYDPVLRALHAWNGLVILFLLLTSLAADALSQPVAALWRLHVWLGYGLLLGVVGRIVWGWVGPARARWGLLWQPRIWWQAWRQKRLLALDDGLAPPPLAAMAYGVSYTVMGLAIGSGLVLVAVEFDSGPLRALLGLAFAWGDLARDLHELGEKWFYLFLLLHVAAMIWHERRDGVPMAQGMVSGWHYHREP